MRAESLFTAATYLERLPPRGGDPLASYGGASLHEQSHGESFLSIAMHRLGPGGLYLLDEPEAALSPMRQMSLLAILHRLTRAGSQLIIATHSPILLAYPEAAILQFGAGGIERVAYEETEHYRVTRDFLNRYPRMLDVLFGDEAAEDGR